MSGDKYEVFKQKQPLYPDVSAQDNPHTNPYQPTTVIVEQPAPSAHVERRRTFVGQIVTSCLVTWCCCILFGGIAFILAMVANSRSANGKSEEAKKMGRASCWMSVAGMVIGFIVGAIFIGIYIGLVAAAQGHFKFITDKYQSEQHP